MWRKYWTSIIIISACFCLILPNLSQATGEDIYVVSTGGESTFHTLLDDDYNVTTKTTDELTSEGLPSSVELLIYPGGLAPITQAQDSALVAVIQDYVNQGGSYFGSCGGSIPGAQDLNWDYGTLAMIGLAQVNAIDRISWATTVAYTDGFTFNNNTLNGDYAGKTKWLSYTGGPAFDVVEGYEDDVEVLATFAENFKLAETSYYQVKSKAAIISTTYGSGKVILSAPHPETSTDTRFLFDNYIEELLPEEVEETPVPDDDEEEEEEEEEIDDDNDEVPDYVISKVKNLRVPKKKKRKKKVYLKWNKIDDVSGYNIRLLKWNKKKQKYKKKRTIKINKNRASKWIKKLKSGKKYKVRVRAKINYEGVATDTLVTKGPWSKAKKFRTKKNK